MTGDAQTASRRSLQAALFIAVLLTLVGHRQLFIPLSFNTQDHVDGYVRATEYATEWARGHWAQSLPHAYFGGGDAFPRFYPPLSHVAAAAAYRVLGDPVLAVHLTGLMAIVLGAILLGTLVHRLTGSVLLAGGASTLYGLFPYTFMQMQVRGAFAESWGAAWYPLVLLAGLWSAESRRLHPVYPISIALLMLSHTVMTLWALPFLLMVAVIAQPERILALRHAFVASVLGALLAGFHLLSVATGVPKVRAGDPEVLHATPDAIVVANQHFGLDTLPIALFPALLLLGVFATVMAFRAPRDEGKRRVGTAALGGAFLLASLMAAPRLVWEILPSQLLFIQFPARLLSPASFLLILVLALAPRWNLESLSRRALGLTLVVVAAAAFLAGWRALMPRTVTGAAVHRLVNSDFSATGFNVDQAFLPRSTEPEEITAAILRIRASVGKGPIVSWSTDGSDPVAEVDLPDSSRVTLPLVLYDFLVPRLADGTELSAHSDSGLLSLALPTGRQTVVVGRRIPTSIAAAMAVGLVTLTLLGIWWWTGRPWRRVTAATTVSA